MLFLERALSALPDAAKSPLALIAYAITVIAWVIVATRVARNRNVLRHIASLPERDRLRALEAEMGSVHVAGGVTPEDWLRSRISRYYFVGFMTVVTAITSIVLVSMFARPIDVAPDTKIGIDLGRRFLEEVYGGKLNDAYALLPDQLKSSISFAAFTDSVKTQLYQYRAAPISRRHVSTRMVGDFANITFEAELDSVSVVREVVTLKRDNGHWILWRFSIGPKEWPELTDPKYLNAKSTSELFSQYRADQAKATDPIGFKRRFLEHYIPLPGWTVRLGDVADHRGDATCDRQAIDVTTSRHLILRNVAGGCGLPSGQRVTLFGRLVDMNSDQVSIADTRLFSAEE